MRCCSNLIFCRAADSFIELKMATAREDLQLKLATPGQKDRKQLLEYIEKGQIGYDATLQGPYGTRQGVY